jgi:putative ATP-dependent endonuclease of OLD family
VPGEQREPLEQELEALSVKILANSDTLRSLTEALAALHALIGSMGAPALHPLPAKLEELARLISIDLDTGAGALPVRMHGAGSRSLAALQVQSVLYDKRLGKDGTASSPNPVTLVEEPEAHLHPQASMELEPLLSALRGQKIVSTHSAHLVTTIEPRAIRLIRHRTDGLQVIDLGPSSSDATATHRAFRPDLHVEEMEKLKRFVERPFGEMLYASAIVIGDGATERAFLPPVLRHALGNQAHGVCVIDPESLAGDSARAAVKFATMTETPWVAFADSDPAGQQAIATLLALGDGDKARVVWINSVDSEGVAVPGDIEAMLLSFDAGICHAACLAVRPDLAATPTKKLLDKLKGSVGASLAQQLIVTYPDSRDWPNPLQELIARLRIELS